MNSTSNEGLLRNSQTGMIPNCGAAWLIALIATLSAHAQVQMFQQLGTGAVPRTVQDKLADTVSVKDFGAQCNGVADDTPAFQAAHNSATYGMTINIPAGVCVINSNINVTHDNITWKGSGQAATDIQMGPGVTKLFNVTNGTSRQLFGPEFRDFTVDGSLAPAGVAFYFNSVRTVMIDRVYTAFCYRSYFFDSTSYGTMNTVHLSNFFIEATPDLPGARGILINGGGDDWFINNGRLTQDSQSQNNIGIEITSAGGLSFSNIDISQWGRAMVIDPPAGSLVRFGQFSAIATDTSWGDNLTLDGTAAFASGYPNGVYDMTFVNSWFSSAGTNGGNGNGVNIVSAQGIVIDSSQFYSNSLNGARLQSATHNIQISHSTFSSNSNGYGNNGANNGVYSGIAVDANTDSFGIDNNKSGIIGYNQNSQKYGISIAAGCSFYRIIANDLTNNLVGPYNDLSLSYTSRIGLNVPVSVPQQ